ncbi:hypothetical protein EVJ58_g2771 [Rhodofomes roseus]|uniref:DUF6699 domain-containing protein n=1 Tax=Rhodofomes roseus TaxID=34475 RepID=A0A4Y9YNP7_9APHY|nr:hypothetical protein EVJ58_g2771 [Rhodofomes roseus]
MPPWASPHQFPVFVGPHMVGAPGSYFIPPVALPSQQAPNSPVAPVGSGGFSADWTGFPTSASAAPSPYMQAGSPVRSSNHCLDMEDRLPDMGGRLRDTEDHRDMGGPPPGMHPAMWSMMGMGMPMATPFVMPTGWPGTPFAHQGAGGLPPQAAPAPPPSAASAPPSARVPPMYANQFDKVDKFAEGPHYGPVLTPVMVKKKAATTSSNGTCSSPPRSVSAPATPPTARGPAGGARPATWPRVTSLRIVSRAVPSPIEVTAANMEAGVTCGDVIEAISGFMNGRLTQTQYSSASDAQKRVLSEAYYHNRSTAQGVPGGRLPQTLLRFDWLGQDTMYGGCVANEQLIRELCGGLLPCVYELKTMRRYPMSEQEIEEHERREAESESRRSRSRRRSRATSRATSVATSRVASEQPEEDDD